MLFIVLTQLLFQYCIIEHQLQSVGLHPEIHWLNFLLVVLASVLIAGSGNIINDYFDFNIDLINKPHKLIIHKFISRRWIIFWHLFLSSIGIIISFYVAAKIHFIWLGIINTICVLLLFIYSASLKKKFLIGNIVISLLTAWVIVVLLLPEYFAFNKYNSNNVETFYKIIRLGILYASFSFIISLIREIAKDMEDIEGDRQHGCKTLPIKMGLNAAKVFLTVWLVVIIGLLVIAQIYVIRFGWWESILYALIFIIIPLINIQKKLLKALSSNDFNILSSKIKWVMLFGILSIIFFAFYQ